MTLLTAPDVPFSPYYRGGQSVSPKALRPPKSGAVGLKGHDRTAFGIVAPGRARVARRPPGGSRRAPRPRSAPLPRPPPVRAPAKPARDGTTGRAPLGGSINPLRGSTERGRVQSLIDQDQEQPNAATCPGPGDLPRVRGFVTPASRTQRTKQFCLVPGACRCVSADGTDGTLIRAARLPAARSGSVHGTGATPSPSELSPLGGALKGSRSNTLRGAAPSRGIQRGAQVVKTPRQATYKRCACERVESAQGQR